MAESHQIGCFNYIFLMQGYLVFNLMVYSINFQQALICVFRVFGREAVGFFFFPLVMREMVKTSQFVFFLFFLFFFLPFFFFLWKVLGYYMMLRAFVCDLIDTLVKS